VHYVVAFAFAVRSLQGGELYYIKRVGASGAGLGWLIVAFFLSIYITMQIYIWVLLARAQRAAASQKARASHPAAAN